jgi:two-component system, NarL family, sensor histidine kinase UhpB
VSGYRKQALESMAMAQIRRRWNNSSLLWKVFAANAIVFAVAVATLAWAPVTVHRVATPGELVVLGIGLVLMLVFDLLLLRRAFGPLRTLASTMENAESTLGAGPADSYEGASAEVRALGEALVEMLDRLERERRDSARRELAAQERERLRIARELHDEVGQMLTAIALRAERAAEEAGGVERTALLEISRTALGSLEDVRRIAMELRPEALDDLGLVNAVVALCGRVDRQRGIRVRRELDWSLPRLSPEAELVIYRVAQEALTNVLRHAAASEVVVELRREPSAVILEVADNGRGIQPEAVEKGIRGMRERASVIDAKLYLRTRPEGGTCLTLSVPA